MLAAQLRYRHPCLHLAQEANDLIFGELLLHVQSPCRESLGSQVRRYTIRGRRRTEPIEPGSRSARLRRGWTPPREGPGTANHPTKAVRTARRRTYSRIELVVRIGAEQCPIQPRQPFAATSEAGKKGTMAITVTPPRA